jgi:hypothetical protein
MAKIAENCDHNIDPFSLIWIFSCYEFIFKNYEKKSVNIFTSFEDLFHKWQNSSPPKSGHADSVQ